jgi:hypothetical protein
VPEDLFTVTGDVWDLDVAASGVVDVNVADRPGEVVRFAPDGARIATLARLPRAIQSKMVVALPDGRDVVDARVSGRMRLMVNSYPATGAVRWCGRHGRVTGRSSRSSRA